MRCFRQIQLIRRALPLFYGFQVLFSTHQIYVLQRNKIECISVTQIVFNLQTFCWIDHQFNQEKEIVFRLTRNQHKRPCFYLLFVVYALSHSNMFNISAELPLITQLQLIICVAKHSHTNYPFYSLEKS